MDVWLNVTYGPGDKLQTMLDYCDQDVRVLEEVYRLIEGVVPHKIHQGVVDGLEKWTCPHCGSNKLNHEKERPTASGTIRHQMKCRKDTCGKYFTISGKLYIAYLKDRLKND
jgi:uncharacterized protein (DUF983 family)